MNSVSSTARKARITKRIVDALRPSGLVWDTEVKGFGARCTPGGHKGFVLKYRTRGGRQRFYTIGTYGSPWTADMARAEAKRLLGQVVAGEDPAADREQLKQQMLTVNGLAERYMAEHARVHKKQSSADLDELTLRVHLRPALGHLLVSEVSRKDILKLHAGLKHKPGAANQCLALASKMFHLAEEWGLREDGAALCRHIKKYPLRRRQRFLSNVELVRLAEAMEHFETTGAIAPSILNLFRLLILTGARLNEIKTARWVYVDWEGRALRLPDSKTGPKTLQLPAPALQLLQGLPRLSDNPFLLPGGKPGQCLVGVQKAWQRVRQRADLADVRIHDLRHSFASVMAQAGDSLLVIGAVLGHKHQSTTARYAHLSEDPVRSAADKAAERIAAAMKLRTA